MRNETRALFSAYVSQIALLNSVPDATVRFSVDPSIEQKLEERMKESSEFLSAINMVPVTQQVGQTIGLEATRTIAGRTNTAGGNRRNPTDPTGNEERNNYHCRQTNFDWARSYAAMDAWRHRPDFETKLRDAILKQQGRDRIMIGWHGTHAAVETDRAAFPMLQDVNEGWLHKIRTRAPEMVLLDGSLSVHSDGTDDDATKAIYVKAGAELYDSSLDNAVDAAADYSSLDALVLDAKRLLPEWHRGDTDLVVIAYHDLVDDKYFNIVQNAGATATEVEAADRIIRSNKQIGGLPAVRVPFFPADGILITRLDNLSIYFQEGTRRRQLRDESEYDRIANYESVNEDYVVEDYELAVLVENIVIGAAPARPDPA
ncbi:phage major capsid protein, P2 family [Croceicoccus sp. YJ47]|uniref:phage major capsid protein, P2 family n=1 Tax=Croceicoccus sp. YJ47 TaxID=2798724 RepID=UPI0019241DF0|nr:phage major capsid protein, P2 family [Croceicoccus sp. YJ47]QQN73184.1 P2 family phage major capsid protein [Croceicoccus sp. YJ47]